MKTVVVTNLMTGEEEGRWVNAKIEVDTGSGMLYVKDRSDDELLYSGGIGTSKAKVVDVE